jgi:hypothetical protein
MNSEILDPDRVTEDSYRVLVQVGRAARDSARTTKIDSNMILSTLSGLAEVQRIVDVIDNVKYPPSAIDQPFGSPNSILFVGELVLPNWSIDDAAWVVEAICISCTQAGVTEDVEVAVRLKSARPGI